MEQLIIQYAPIAMMVLFLLLKVKLFITPKQLEEAIDKNKASCKSNCRDTYVTKEEMQIERKQLLKEVREQYLSIFAFREFEKRIDDKFDNNNKRFDKLDENVERVHTGIDHLKDLFLQRSNKDA